MKVLLVEDEIDVGKVILSYLKQWEMEAIHAESFQDARSKFWTMARSIC